MTAKMRILHAIVAVLALSFVLSAPVEAAKGGAENKVKTRTLVAPIISSGPAGFHEIQVVNLSDETRVVHWAILTYQGGVCFQDLNGVGFGPGQGGGLAGNVPGNACGVPGITATAQSYGMVTYEGRQGDLRASFCVMESVDNPQPTACLEMTDE